MTSVRVALLYASIVLLLHSDILFAIAPITVLETNWSLLLGSSLLVLALVTLMAAPEDISSKFLLLVSVVFAGAISVSIGRSVLWGSSILAPLGFVGLLLIALVVVRSLEGLEQELQSAPNVIVFIGLVMALVQILNHEFISVAIASDGSGLVLSPSRQMLYHPGAFGSVAIYSMAVLLVKIPTSSRRGLFLNVGLFLTLFYASTLGLSRLPGLAALVLLGFLFVALLVREGFRIPATFVLLLGLAMWFGLRPAALRWETENSIPRRLLHRYQLPDGSVSVIDPVRFGEFQDAAAQSVELLHFLIGEKDFYGANSGVVFLVMNFGWLFTIVFCSLILSYLARNVSGLMSLFIVGYFLADFSITAVVRFPGVLVFGLLSLHFISIQAGAFGKPWRQIRSRQTG